MTTNLPPSKCTVYDWCTLRNHAVPGAHQAGLDLVELLDSREVVEVNLYAFESAPVVRVLYPGVDGEIAHIDLTGDVAGAIAHIIGFFEGRGLNDRRGLREFASLLSEGAGDISGVSEL